MFSNSGNANRNGRQISIYEILEPDSFYSKTGFVLLEGKDGKAFFYYKKGRILIPYVQEYMDRAYIRKEITEWDKYVVINGTSHLSSVLKPKDAKWVMGVFSKLIVCDKWQIGERNWMLDDYHFVYDGTQGDVRYSVDWEELYILNCIYIPKSIVTSTGSDWRSDEFCWNRMGLYPVKNEGMEAQKEGKKEKKKNMLEGLYPAKNEGMEAQKEKKKKISDQIRKLLDCDKRRCRLEPYAESMLYDIDQGHWELFGTEETSAEADGRRLVPRDPHRDIKKGVVGIDFGTKSTVVFYQNNLNEIRPIRVGTGILSAEVKESDYENPTMIECSDLDTFIAEYHQKAGRPNTNCDDFFVSYDAFRDCCACPPSEFYAYFAELKQWANHEKENAVIMDKHKKQYQLGDEVSEKEKTINPIELYAYYIGMYINNMWNGIYLKYLLSFPVGYSVETRQLILQSFEKGIRKSLPSCILENENSMKDFSVQLGISEPAAYAVTALENSGLDPETENDKYMYGIFDFGGGTTDFDFGIWRGASEKEYDGGYDYVLECFGADSDVTLGGENILELLAYQVFQNNKKLAREKRLVCTLPIGEQAFLGSETLVNDSQIARRNMLLLKEELRPLWHQEDGWEDNYRHVTDVMAENVNKNGYTEYIELALYDMEGKAQPNCRFEIDTDELLTLIRERIKKGITAFFRCLEKTFWKEARDEKEKVHIFLAGNSSKSVFVEELFKEKTEEYYQRFKVNHPNAKNSYFEIHKPLKSREQGQDKFVLNGKTSVAYGLLKSREGSSIKVVKNYETDANSQTRFQFYLGRERRRYFECQFSPVEVEYGQWISFQAAVKQIIRIYYTKDPMADSKVERMPIDGIKYEEITIEPQEDAFLFIRAVEPAAIEYTVAVSEETIENQKIEKLFFQ